MLAARVAAWALFVRAAILVAKTLKLRPGIARIQPNPCSVSPIHNEKRRRGCSKRRNEEDSHWNLLPAQGLTQNSARCTTCHHAAELSGISHPANCSRCSASQPPSPGVLNRQVGCDRWGAKLPSLFERHSMQLRARPCEDDHRHQPPDSNQFP